MTKSLWQNSLYALIIIAVAAICLYLSPRAAPTPHGIFLPTIAVGKPIQAEQVQLYSSFPENYTVVGQIRTAIHTPAALTQATIDSDAKSSALYARNLAAEAGANGVVITTVGSTSEAEPLSALVVYGTAISVSK